LRFDAAKAVNVLWATRAAFDGALRVSFPQAVAVAHKHGFSMAREGVPIWLKAGLWNPPHGPYATGSLRLQVIRNRSTVIVPSKECGANSGGLRNP